MENWKYSDRRSALRIPCDIDCQIKDKAGKLMEGKIVDIGLRGLRLVVPGQLRKGSQIELCSRTADQGAVVKCRIEWKTKAADGNQAGASFQDSEDALAHSWLIEEVKAIGSEAQQTSQRRRGVRVICDLPVRLSHAADKREGVLLDLGLGGALVECAGDPLKVKEDVRLDFGPLAELSKVAIIARVVAVYDRHTPRYGVRFDTFKDGGVTDLDRYLAHLLNESAPPTV